MTRCHQSPREHDLRTHLNRGGQVGGRRKEQRCLSRFSRFYGHRLGLRPPNTYMHVTSSNRTGSSSAVWNYKQQMMRCRQTVTGCECFVERSHVHQVMAHLPHLVRRRLVAPDNNVPIHLYRVAGHYLAAKILAECQRNGRFPGGCWACAYRRMNAHVTQEGGAGSRRNRQVSANGTLSQVFSCG